MDNIIKCPLNPRNLEIPEENFGQRIMRGIRNSPGVVMVDVSTWKEITGPQLARQVENISAGLTSLGCHPGDVIGIFSPNSMEWITILTSVLYMDCISSGFNHLLKEDELAILLESCRTKVLFCAQSSADIAIAAVKKLKNHKIEKVIVVGSHAGYMTLEDLITQGEKFSRTVQNTAKVYSRGKAPASIMFSSGTTGLQKPVLLSHEGLNLESLLGMHPITRFVFDVTIVFAPMSHVAGFLLATIGLMNGCIVAVMPKYDLKQYLDTMVKYKIRKVFAVPPVATQLAKSPLVDELHIQLEELVIGAAPLGKEVELELYKKFPEVRIRQMYGMTELSGVTTLVPNRTSHKEPKMGSIGIPGFNTEMKVIDIETGVALPMKRSGEICMRSPLRMIEYINNTEATRDTIDENEWVHSGDVGYYDEDGYFFVTDRIKELIKFNAYQVAPAELESVLLSHPDVADAAVVGIPDPNSGEVPLAVIVPRPDSSPNEKDILTFVNDKVAAHKKLRGGVKFVSVIPKTGSGKILRREIKANLLQTKL